MMSDPIAASPKVVVIAGPNGAGKTTTAPLLLRGAMGVSEFVNADVIAQGLSGLHPERVAVQAGRIMLTRLRELADARADFAFETTLASRSFAPWLRELSRSGYEVFLFFLWLPAAALAVKRVSERVSMGGHHVPDETVTRRHERGIRNFFHLYQSLTTEWKLYDNSKGGLPILIAKGRGEVVDEIADPATWFLVRGQYADDGTDEGDEQ